MQQLILFAVRLRFCSLHCVRRRKQGPLLFVANVQSSRNDEPLSRTRFDVQHGTGRRLQQQPTAATLDTAPSGGDYSGLSLVLTSRF